MKKLVICFFYVWFWTPLNGQSLYSNVWVFGDGIKLDFKTTPPIANSDVATGYVSLEGVASLSDINGNLLFYTNGVKVWNRFNQVVTNGGQLLGNTSSSQSSLFVPHPGDKNLIYLFTIVEEGGALAYSIIDTSLGLANASILNLNTILMPSVSEKITAVKGSDPNTIWIVAHNIASENCYLSYKINLGGLDSTPVKSYSGRSETLGSGWGCMKFSSNGKILATALLRENAVELFSFDDVTGNLKLICTIHDIIQPYGIEFSNNGQLLYVFADGSLKQFDFSEFEESFIRNNTNEILSFKNDECSHGFYLGGTCARSIQKAKNGRLYFGGPLSDSSLWEITYPDLKGSSCGLIKRSVVLPQKTKFGLPNFVTSYFNFDTSVKYQFPIDSFDVYLKPLDGEPFIPNVFTPNGDRLNDQFEIHCTECEIEGIQIFNRWGTVVFSSNTSSTSIKWDGLYSGAPVVEGLYYYLIKVKESARNGGASVIKHGVVNVMQ